MQVVIGNGPVGRTVVEQLVTDGEEVRLLTRSGSGPEHPLVHRVAVDAREHDALAEQLDGADAVFHCAHAAYTAQAWRRELLATEQSVLAAAAGTVVVFPESLYSYTATGAPMTEDGPRDAAGGKRGIRTELLAARAASTTPTVSVVASDFYGPHVLTAHAGERMVPRVLASRRVTVLGRTDVPHSFTYVPDLAAAMVTAAGRRDLWDTVLHAPTVPAVTQAELVAALATAAGTRAKVSAIPGWALRAMGRVSGSLHEVAELGYQFTEPFVMTSARSEQLLGRGPTPLAEAASATVAWWRARA